MQFSIVMTHISLAALPIEPSSALHCTGFAIASNSHCHESSMHDRSHPGPFPGGMEHVGTGGLQILPIGQLGNAEVYEEEDADDERPDEREEELSQGCTE